MLENLLQLIKEQGQQDVVDNPEIPNEHNADVMAEASQAVAGTMQSAIANGDSSNIQSLFDSSSDDDIKSNPLAQNMQGSFVDSITSKLGINKNVAMGIAASLIPMVLSKLVNRTKSNSPQDSGFSLPGLISSLTGGGNNSSGGIDIGGMLGQLTGNNQNTNTSNSGFNLPDIISKMSGGAQNQQSKGGLQDIIKGFFK